MMKTVPSISDAEWQIMKILWEQSPLTANQIVEKLEGKTDWKPKTIKTLISRLKTKQAIGYEEEGRTYLFFPKVREEECVQEESRSFLRKVFDGNLNVMIANFIEQKALSKKDIEELKKLLEDKME